MIEREQRQLKEYKYWSVRLHGNQGYLGRCLIWCKRVSVEDLSQCTQKEWIELAKIIKELKLAAEKLFQPDRFNYAFLGNIELHLHGHFIPRYKETREYDGLVFQDDRWGQNYQTNADFVIPDDSMLNIIKDYKSALDSN